VKKEDKKISPKKPLVVLQRYLEHEKYYSGRSKNQMPKIPKT
jgi:hypothetical protein